MDRLGGLHHSQVEADRVARHKIIAGEATAGTKDGVVDTITG